MNLVEHALYELKLAGYDVFTEYPEGLTDPNSYTNSIAKSVIRLLETFSEEEHSGFSGGSALALFNKLVKYENLTPLTNNKEEWVDVGKYEDLKDGVKFQSKRKYSCFSEDGLKTYYDLNDMEVLVEEDGMSYTTMDRSKKVFYKLEG